MELAAILQEITYHCDSIERSYESSETLIACCVQQQLEISGWNNASELTQSSGSEERELAVFELQKLVMESRHQSSTVLRSMQRELNAHQLERTQHRSIVNQLVQKVRVFVDSQLLHLTSDTRITNVWY